MKQLCDDMPEGIRVWVVDDDADCRTLVRDAIIGAANDWQVEEVPDSAEALDLLHKAAADSQRRPDMILLDVNMPGASGLDVLRGAKADPATANIPIVMLTAASGPGLRDEAMRIGAAEYYCKPVSSEKFRQTVVSAMRHCLRIAGTGQLSRAPWREDETSG